MGLCTGEIEARGAMANHERLDVLAAMATNETEMTTGESVSEHKRSGFQSPLHREFCNPSAQALPWEAAQAWAFAQNYPGGSHKQKDRRRTDGKVEEREVSGSQGTDRYQQCLVLRRD